MIRRAEERGDIKPGDTLIEATSGNTGIALAMAAAIRGYRMVLIMPEDLSIERAQTMKAFGAELILTPRSRRHGVRARPGRADAARRQGPRARPVRQRRQPAHPLRDHRPRDLGSDTDGRITHFVSAMGTTGTITGVSRYLKEQQPGGAHHRRAAQRGLAHPGHPQVAAGVPAEDLRPDACRRAGARVSQADAEDMARRLAREEGLFAGISAAGACWVALQRGRARCENATIVFIVCDRGDRYLSTGVFPA